MWVIFKFPNKNSGWFPMFTMTHSVDEEDDTHTYATDETRHLQHLKINDLTGQLLVGL